ncbi:MAG TPA: hypothetical protein VHV75_12440, partial [Solirubrobacteraceae bacterium]|nr:hypothetical protein [Solirubrobacteraceae bacterium]
VWLWLTNLSLLVGLEINAELARQRAIDQGSSENVEPFAEPRDTRKLSNKYRHELEQSAEARRDTTSR